MSILDTIGQAMDAVLEAEELEGVIEAPPGSEWGAWEKARRLLAEAAMKCSQDASYAATRCTEYAREQGLKQCGICWAWKPPEELTEEVAGYESKKGESSRSRWHRCRNQCKPEILTSKIGGG